ncbi:hypothetical protein LX36DRAFT_58946 [Colletotrichum falcatum]|nr:hypothetical protein LX36DRAFT_58946 [Colletotrichum falcatum]
MLMQSQRSNQVANSGSVFGPVLGGVITQYSTWRWCFYINMPIGAVVLLFLAWCNIPEQLSKPDLMEVLPRLHKYLDFVGFVSSAAAAAVLLTALQIGGNTYPFGSPVVIGNFCGSAGALAAFLVWNYRKGETMG